MLLALIVALEESSMLMALIELEIVFLTITMFDD